MNNVGDTARFTISGTRTDDLTYCWFWWDNSVDATTVPTVQKALNMGGDPRWSGTLPVTVEVVDALGQFGIYQTSIIVNNPPQLVPGSANVEPNGKIITYNTTLQADVYDLEGHVITPSWSSSGIVLGVGSSASIGNVNAYWNGTYVGQAAGTRFSYPYTVAGSADLRLTVVDSVGGRLDVDYRVYGFERSDVYFATSAGPESQIGDASSKPTVTVGENASFTVYSNAGNRVSFVWGFWGTNGWTVPSSGNGQTSVLPDGTIRNTKNKGTTGELPGSKLAEITVIDLDHGVSSTTTVPVTLVLNDAPQAISYTITPVSPTAGDDIRFSEKRA